jgi:hypothetical protein
MIGELESIWKEAIMAKSRHHPDICLEEPRKTSVNTAGVLTENQTQYLPNTSQRRWPYANLLGKVLAYFHI